MLAGGTSKPLLLGLQQAASGWRGGDFSTAGLAELAWALASCGQPLSEGCRQLLRSALGADSSSIAAEERAEGQQSAVAGEQQQREQLDGLSQAAAAAPPARHQQQRQRDWQGWFQGAPASRVVLLLWAAARLECRPCAACLEAAAAVLLQEQHLAGLPTKVRAARQEQGRLWHAQAACHASAYAPL